MKKNDYFALNLNLENTTIDPNNLRTYGITPDNTGLQEKDYYRKPCIGMLDLFQKKSIS